MTAKTGQALIAHPIFSLLPEPVEAMDIDTAAPTPAAEGAEASTSASTSTPPQPKKYTPPVDQATNDLIPEAIVYLRLLIILAAIDAGKIAEAGEFALETANIVQQANRRTMDQIAAKIYFYLARAYETQDRLAELRS
jgi:26S proteasome regulatory subunit N3